MKQANETYLWLVNDTKVTKINLKTLVMPEGRRVKVMEAAGAVLLASEFEAYLMASDNVEAAQVRLDKDKAAIQRVMDLNRDYQTKQRRF